MHFFPVKRSWSAESSTRSLDNRKQKDLGITSISHDKKWVHSAWCMSSNYIPCWNFVSFQLFLTPTFFVKTDPRNQSSIEAIETSQFILCLDDSSGTVRPLAGVSHQHTPLHHHHSSNHLRRDSISRVKMDLSFRAYHLLTGGGTDLFTGNRWHDKFMNFVVGRDGVCGLVIEHTGSEGITLTRFLHEFLDYIGKGGSGSISTSSSGSGFHSSSIQRVDSSKRMVSSEVIQRLNERKVFHLKFVVDDVVSRGIHEASKRVDKLIDDLDLYVLQFKEFGKSFIKQQSMSPDAFIQIALQLTHYKVHRRHVSSYESAGLRQFKNGRVDNIRSCTIPVLFWAQAMCDEVPQITVCWNCLSQFCPSIMTPRYFRRMTKSNCSRSAWKNKLRFSNM